MLAWISSRRWRSLAVCAAGLAMGAAGLAAAAAEPAYFAKNWLVDDGLLHNTVNRVVQDPRGFLWLASSGGLARFDGREFKEYPLPSVSPEATFNIRDVTVEPDGALVLLPATGGVVRLRGDVFAPHPIGALLGSRTLLSVHAEPDGTLWVGAGGAVVFRWQNGQLQTFDREHGLGRRASGRPLFARDVAGRMWIAAGESVVHYREGALAPLPGEVGSVGAIGAARSGGLWIATDERLWKWENEQLRPMSGEGGWLPPRAGVQHVFEDSAGTLWIATRQAGLFRFSGGRATLVPTAHHQVSSVSEDNEGNLWITMDGGGLSRLRLQSFVLLDAAAGMPNTLTSSVCEDAQGSLWCANRGGGVVRYRNGEIQSYWPPGGGAPFVATNVCPDKDDDIWVGAIDGLYVLPRDGSGPMRRVPGDIRAVRSLFCARNGDMWVSWGESTGSGYQLGYFRAGQYHDVRTARGNNGKHVTALAEDGTGVIWFSSTDGELLSFAEGRVTLRLSREASPVGRVETILVDAHGAMWLGGVRGLALREGERMSFFSRAHGLPDDLISQVLQDDRGRLWMNSRRGFFCVEVEQLRAVAAGRAEKVAATTFGREDGLTGISSPLGGRPLAWQARDGRLWFVSNRGVVGLDPAASLPARPLPPVYIDAALVDDLPVPVQGRLRVPAGVHHVEFRFAALNYAVPEKVRVRYQLANFDPAWIDAGAARSATYTRLPPGDYTLRAMAGNQDGRWNEAGAAVLAFTVLPAWWQTWWWRSAFVFGFTGGAVWLGRYWSHRRLRRKLARLEQENSLERERARIARDLHDELGGSLTQIGMLADRLRRQHPSEDELKPELGHLAWRTRRLAGELESIVWTVSPKNNTWDRLALFIGQYVRGFCRDTTLKGSVSGDNALPAAPLSPEAQHNILSVLKEALNNILKHAQATRVDVDLAWQGGQFVMRIADDGIGFDPAAAEHAERNGLSNMRTRMAEIGGEIEIRSQPGHGTGIVVRQPMAAIDPPPAPAPTPA